jgi:hypothetical protein
MPSRADYQKQLAEAERHIEDGLRHIEDQRAVIRQRQADGHDTTESKELLSELLDAQNLHEMNRQRVLRELEHDPEKWEPVFGKDHAQTKS